MPSSDEPMSDSDLDAEFHPQDEAQSTFTWTEEAGEPFLGASEALRALAAALGHGGRGNRIVDVIIVSAKTLAAMHAQFLNDPTETDVITFDLEDDTPGGPKEPGGGPDAEIYISADRARELSPSRAVAPARELALYVVHGALHLCGMDDHKDVDRAEMRAAERAVMESLGYPMDSAPHDIDC